MPKEVPLSGRRGETLYYDLEVEKGGVPLDLTGSTIRFVAKHSVADPDVDAVVTKTSNPAGGITIAADQTADGDRGSAVLRIEDDDLDDLEETTTLQYEVQVTEATGDVLKPFYGPWRIGADVAQTSP